MIRPSPSVDGEHTLWVTIRLSKASALSWTPISIAARKPAVSFLHAFFRLHATSTSNVEVPTLSEETRPSMKSYASMLIGLVAVSAAWADGTTSPTINENDTWTYRQTVEKGPSQWNQSREELKVTRATSTLIYYSSRPSGSSQPPRESFSGVDWSRTRDVNGKETIVNQPLSFPLTTGKKWEISYTEMHPNKTNRSEQWNSKYRVVGYESVEVPAGKFDAIKIEAEGHWTAELEPTQTVVQSAQSTSAATTMVTQAGQVTAGPVAGRTYKAFWYVPQVKRWVKSVEEYYGAGGVRNERYTQELESYKVSN